VRKSEEAAGKLVIIEEESRKIPCRTWAEMMRKVYEVDPLVCPECGGRMKIVAFITDYSVLDRIINHLKLRFIADKPPPPRIASQKVLMAAEAGSEYFS
jgi:transposase